MSQAVDMGQGKVSHVLGRLALPLMVSLFFQNLYAYADTVFVSWLGETPLAAISLALPLTYLALFALCSRDIRILDLAQVVGRRTPRTPNRLFWRTNSYGP